MTREEENTLLAKGYSLWKIAVLSRDLDRRTQANRELNTLFLDQYMKLKKEQEQ
jgi:hypothetical protein